MVFDSCMGPPGRFKKRHTHTPRWRLVGALAGLVVLGAGLATWALVASSPPARQARQAPATTAEVTLAVSCRGCVPCGPDGNCPECDHKLAAAAGGVPGVVSASFAEHRSSGVGHVSYRLAQTSLTVIEATIERAPPYPGCCSSLHATGTRRAT